jgi:hypothetical protein
MESVDLLTAITNLSGQLDSILVLLKYLAYALGLAYIGQAIMKGLRASSGTGMMGPDQSSKGWFGTFLVAGLLLDMDHTTGVVFSSFSGGSSLTGLPGGGAAAALGYVPVGGADFSAAIVAVLRVVSLLGWYTTLRGFMCWKAAAEGGQHGQDDPAWQGATHILFGSLLINITETMAMVRSSVLG